MVVSGHYLPEALSPIIALWVLPVLLSFVRLSFLSAFDLVHLVISSTLTRTREILVFFVVVVIVLISKGDRLLKLRTGLPDRRTGDGIDWSNEGCPIVVLGRSKGIV